MERGESTLQDYPILINITVALVAAFVGGIIARRLKLPALVGYLLAGIIIGPFTPGFVGDQHTIRELADLGIIFLLFGVGLHFSLRDLWAVRDIALPGAILQMLICASLGILLTRFWGWELGSGVVLGLSIAVASTVVVLRNLMDRGLLNTTTGQVAVGWLVQEDLATVLILVLLPAFSTESTQPIWLTAGLALLKTAIFAAIMLFVGIRIIPWALQRIVHFRSRELFIVAVVVITLGTAIGAALLFGVSLALGAFLAGVVVNESAYSHQVETEILPFRETFAVLFFVSIGMLVNPLLLITRPAEVFSLAALIIIGKSLIILVLGLFFARPARTILILAVSLNQIGEFSFLVGQSGLALKLLTQEQYQLLLMGALFSIVINPLIFWAMPRIEKGLRAVPALWHRLDRHTPVPELIDEVQHNHVVIVGYGRVGQHLVEVLTRLDVSFLVVELDAGRVAELRQQGIPTLYGDAGDSEILLHAHLPTARAVVITIPDAVAAATAVATAHSVAPDVLLLARAATRDNVRQLTELGATAVIYPELEGGLALLDQALIRLGYSEQKVHQYLEAVRQDSYDLTISSPREQEALANLRPSLALQEKPRGGE
jgi:monovalent cation:H+ antiporter-2, CPA2 family